jgi:hypothetical protein
MPATALGPTASMTVVLVSKRPPSNTSRPLPPHARYSGLRRLGRRGSSRLMLAGLPTLRSHNNFL